jgi:nicotinamide phosphoribosyltransferase
MFNHGWAAENIIFGQGGGLLQSVNRDTCRFAFKCSSQYYDGEWHDVYKRPKDISKCSKRGLLKLIKVNDENGNPFYKTVQQSDDQLPDELKDVFIDGRLVREYSFDEIRNRVNS